MTRLVPPRFAAFIVLLIVGTGAATLWLAPLKALMAGFDVAALVFLVSCFPLLNDDTGKMRKHAQANDANRSVLLAVTVTVTTVILVAVGFVIADGHLANPPEILLVFATLVLAWIFGNSIYALHYAHMYYRRDDDGEGDTGGIGFPETREPDYWDFIYFAFTLGMTFQTSDCDITSSAIRRVSLGHSMAAFVFNLGVLAFTINALGS